MPKFDHAVKYNGKYYPPGADIPEAAPVEEAVEDTAQGAADAAQEPAPVEDGANTPEKAEAPKKAAKGRKKGDA